MNHEQARLKYLNGEISLSNYILLIPNGHCVDRNGNLNKLSYFQTIAVEIINKQLPPNAWKNIEVEEFNF